MKSPKTKAVVVTKQTRDIVSVEQFISSAIETKVPVETMERLFALRKEVKAEAAKEAFIVAMSTFQAKCPIIKKNKDVLNKDKSTLRYSYASLDSIVSQVKEILGANGLSYSTQVKNETGFLTAICTVTHILGHSESSDFKIPIDTEGFMTAPQKYASALTFAKRYAFCNALGILTGEDDADANNVDKKTEISSVNSIKGKIMFLLKELGVDTTKDTVAHEIKKLTSIEVSNDPEILKEIKGRLEVLLKEKTDANA